MDEQEAALMTVGESMMTDQVRMERICLINCIVATPDLKAKHYSELKFMDKSNIYKYILCNIKLYPSFLMVVSPGFIVEEPEDFDNQIFIRYD